MMSSKPKRKKLSRSQGPLVKSNSSQTWLLRASSPRRLKAGWKAFGLIQLQACLILT
jgi:hypothetical protein